MDARLIGQRARSMALAVPILTRVLAAAALLPALIILLAGLTPAAAARRVLSRVCLSASPALFRLQLWRLVLYPFFHHGILQALLNLVAFVPLCAALERREGTLRAAAALGALSLVQAALYLLPSALFFALLGGGRRAARIVPCATGLGGHVFGLLALEVHVASDRGRVRPLGGGSWAASAGVAAHPKPLAVLAYPWVLLLVVQLLSPRGAALMLHLAGLLAGEALARGLLSRLASVSDAALRKLEAPGGVGGSGGSSGGLLNSSNDEGDSSAVGAGAAWLRGFLASATARAPSALQPSLQRAQPHAYRAIGAAAAGAAAASRFCSRGARQALLWARESGAYVPAASSAAGVGWRPLPSGGEGGGGGGAELPPEGVVAAGLSSGFAAAAAALASASAASGLPARLAAVRDSLPTEVAAAAAKAAGQAAGLVSRLDDWQRGFYFGGGGGGSAKGGGGPHHHHDDGDDVEAGAAVEVDLRVGGTPVAPDQEPVVVVASGGDGGGSASSSAAALSALAALSSVAGGGGGGGVGQAVARPPSRESALAAGGTGGGGRTGGGSQQQQAAAAAAAAPPPPPPPAAAPHPHPHADAANTVASTRAEEEEPAKGLTPTKGTGGEKEEAAAAMLAAAAAATIKPPPSNASGGSASGSGGGGGGGSGGGGSGSGGGGGAAGRAGSADVL